MSDERVFIEAMLYAMEGKNPSKAIEDQEKREQQNVVRNHRLPIKTNGGMPRESRFEGIQDWMPWEVRARIEQENVSNWTKQQYERMGIRILEKYDDLFYSVELPEGWEVKRTEHHMWNDVFDEKGRKRISFFYKGAFYDRDAHSNFLTRYSYSVLPFDNYESDATYEERKFKQWSVYMTDCDEKLLLLGKMTPANDEEYWAINNTLGAIAKKHLNDNCPGWNDINAYWD